MIPARAAAATNGPYARRLDDDTRSDAVSPSVPSPRINVRRLAPSPHCSQPSTKRKYQITSRTNERRAADASHGHADDAER